MPAIPPGSVCDCVRGGATFLVYVLSLSGKQASALSESDSKTHSLNLNWLVHPADYVGYLQRGGDDKRELLKAVSQRREAIRAGIEVETLWQFVTEGVAGTGLWTPAALARLYFGGEPGVDEWSAMLRALLADHFYFEARGDEFVPHTPARVDELRHALEREEKKKARLAAAARSLAEGPFARAEYPDLADALRRQFIHLPEKPAAGVKELLAAVRVNPASESQLHRCLVRAGLLGELDNYHLERFKIIRHHAEPLVAEAERLADEPLDATLLHGLADRTGRPAVTIDERRTVSYDDAFDLETLPDGRHILSVHIAAPALRVAPGSPLFEAACTRATSVFFPDEKFEMFPDRLANETFSLVAGGPRPVVTARFTVEGETVTATELFPSLIRVAENLAYSEVDKGHAGPLTPADLEFLDRFTGARRFGRIQAGALVFDQKEVLIGFDGDRVTLELQDRAGSRLMIEELMILTNSAFADAFARAGVPAIFRSQPPMRPGPSPDLSGLRDSAVPAVLHHHFRRRMAPSETGLAPRPHASLGLAAYTQASSPIRRISDLVVQLQLLRLLRGEPTYPGDQLEEWMFRGATGVRDAAVAERERRRFLTLKYAEQNPAEVYDATVVDLTRAVIVSIPKLDCTCEGQGFIKDASLLGTDVKVKIAFVDPPAGEIRSSRA